ncbi:carbohydrate kinase [Aureimonas sp. Leaf454]|uniref:carbohydrate kinase family protein n=1 Tax=Aureimonas sp. Leaf454 TaxID=1736381 RepID=UPI0006F2B913|nr:carbohydrate kinase [Aureimonas sp. Leaf454]KQT45236.1 carbohydrate kinase [Aureimonas sp. Leaf454]
MFLSCGDALFDVFAEPSPDVSQIALNARVGGSALNVALGLARLGHPSAFFTKMSGDLYGRRIRAYMQREAIDQRFLIETTRNTTLAMVSLSESGSAEYSFYIEGTADRSIEASEVPASFPQALQAIHIGGSYSTVSEPTASSLAALIAQEKAQRFVSYDPNIRASIQPDLDVWRDRVAATVPEVAMVKASEEDLEQLYPGRTSDAVLSDWMDKGIALGIVTRGEHGALAYAASGIQSSVDGVAVDVVDTVGAGDTFQAALLSQLQEKRALTRLAIGDLDREALDALIGFAIRAAAITCSRRGADLPRRGDLGLAPLAAAH